MRILAIVATLVLVAGCATGPKYEFPGDIKDELYRARDEARACIESKGTRLGDSYSCTVTKHPGEKKFGQMWCWYSPDWKQYIGGMCSGGMIEVGCNPTTGGEVWYEVEKHEMGHHWLIDIGDWGHDPLYRGCFYNWQDAAVCIFVAERVSARQDDVVRLKALCDEAKEGDWIGAMVIDGDGRVCHIDFVVVK